MASASTRETGHPTEVLDFVYEQGGDAYKYIDRVACECTRASRDEPQRFLRMCDLCVSRRQAKTASACD